MVTRPEPDLWCPVPDHPGYAINPAGEIWSLPRLVYAANRYGDL